MADTGYSHHADKEIKRCGGGGKTLGELWESAKQGIEERRHRGSPELPTGIGFIDTLTDGIHRGEVWTIAGSSGGGKTTLALQIGTNVAREGKRVLVVTLEMRGEELVSRMFCNLKDYDNSMLRVGDYSDSFENKDKDFQAILKTLDMEIVEYGYNFKEITEIFDHYYPNEGIDLLIVDFIQLIDWQDIGDERLALQEYIRKLTELAKTKNVAIMIVSQFRRPPSGADLNRQRDITDLKGTGSLEQLSHVVVLIQKRIEQSYGHKNIKWILSLAKNRHGATDEKEVTFHGATYKFKELIVKEERDFTERYAE